MAFKKKNPVIKDMMNSTEEEIEAKYTKEEYIKPTTKKEKTEAEKEKEESRSKAKVAYTDTILDEGREEWENRNRPGHAIALGMGPINPEREITVTDASGNTKTTTAAQAGFRQKQNNLLGLIKTNSEDRREAQKNGATAEELAVYDERATEYTNQYKSLSPRDYNKNKGYIDEQIKMGDDDYATGIETTRSFYHNVDSFGKENGGNKARQSAFADLESMATKAPKFFKENGVGLITMYAGMLSEDEIEKESANLSKIMYNSIWTPELQAEYEAVSSVVNNANQKRNSSVNVGNVDQKGVRANVTYGYTYTPEEEAAIKRKAELEMIRSEAESKKAEADYYITREWELAKYKDKYGKAWYNGEGELPDNKTISKVFIDALKTIANKADKPTDNPMSYSNSSALYDLFRKELARAEEGKATREDLDRLLKKYYGEVANITDTDLIRLGIMYDNGDKAWSEYSADILEPRYNVASEKEKYAWYNEINENGNFWSKTGAGILGFGESFLYSPYAAIESMASAVDSNVNKSELPTYKTHLGYGQFSSMKSGVDKGRAEIGTAQNADVLEFLGMDRESAEAWGGGMYGLTNSIVENLARSPLGVFGGAAMMFAQSFATEYKSGTDAYSDPTKNAIMSTVTAFSEGLTEKIELGSLNKALDMTRFNPNHFKRMVKAARLSGANEVLGELTNDAVRYISDYALNGEESELYQQARKLVVDGKAVDVSSGMMQILIKNGLNTAVVSYISGMAFGGARGLFNYAGVTENEVRRDGEKLIAGGININELVRLGKESTNPETKKIALEIEKAVASGEGLDGFDVQMLFSGILNDSADEKIDVGEIESIDVKVPMQSGENTESSGDIETAINEAVVNAGNEVKVANTVEAENKANEVEVIRRHKDKLVKSKGVYVDNDFGYDLYAVENNRDGKKTISIVEKSSGLEFGSGNTIDEAMSDATAKIENYGNEKIEQIIRDNKIGGSVAKSTISMTEAVKGDALTVGKAVPEADVELADIVAKEEEKKPLAVKRAEADETIRVKVADKDTFSKQFGHKNGIKAVGEDALSGTDNEVGKIVVASDLENTVIDLAKASGNAEIRESAKKYENSVYSNANKLNEIGRIAKAVGITGTDAVQSLAASIGQKYMYAVRDAGTFDRFSSELRAEFEGYGNEFGIQALDYLDAIYEKRGALGIQIAINAVTDTGYSLNNKNKVVENFATAMQYALKAMGNDVTINVVYDEKAPRGEWNKVGSKTTITINGTKIRGAESASWVLSHELFHEGSKNNPGLADRVIDVFRNMGLYDEKSFRYFAELYGPVFEAQYGDKLNNGAITQDEYDDMYYRYITEEIAADIMFRVIGSEELTTMFANEASYEDLNFIAKFFKKFFGGIKKVFTGTGKADNFAYEADTIVGQFERAIKNKGEAEKSVESKPIQKEVASQNAVNEETAETESKVKGNESEAVEEENVYAEGETDDAYLTVTDKKSWGKTVIKSKGGGTYYLGNKNGEYSVYIEGKNKPFATGKSVDEVLSKLESFARMMEEEGGFGESKYSLSSIGHTFYNNENITAAEAERMLEDGSWKKSEGYKKYFNDCISVYEQAYGKASKKDIAQIEKSIEGIMRVAIAAKKAGYDIQDNGAKRNTRDSKNRLLFTSLEPNSDYITSSDISAICDKRKTFTEIYDDIVRIEEAKNVPPSERFFSKVDNYFILHKIMAEKGLVVPCEECYVESMRKNLAPMANAFITLVTETDAENKKNAQLYNQSGKNKGKLKENNAKIREKVIEICAKNGGSKEQIDKIRNLSADELAKFIDEVGSAENLGVSLDEITVEMLTTAEGLAQLKLRSPLLYEAFNSFYGQSKPKMPKEATPFRPGELIALFTDKNNKINTTLIEKVKSTGGFRLQSYSDFQIGNFVDVLQTIFEASMLGLNGHAYTKVPAFLDATNGTNLKRNLSIFMYEDGGKWMLDKKNSFPMELDDIYALVAEDESGNTSIIAVSQNAKMSAWIMANDLVGYGIPFHKSGLKMDVVRLRDVVTPDGRKIKGYSNQIDHTKQQSEVYKEATGSKKKNSKVSKPIDIYSFWDFENKEGLSKNELIRKNLEAYIDKCDELGYLPKFRDYVMNNDKVLKDVLAYSKELGFVSEDATIDDISFEYKGYRIPYGYYKFLGDFGMFTPDGKASPIKPLSLANYDFDKAVSYFDDAKALRENELLQQFENGKVREEYRQLLKEGKMTLEQLQEVLNAKKNEAVQEVVTGAYKDKKYALPGNNKLDAEYLELAKDPKKNEARLSEMVEEAAKKAGYNSPLLYHGAKGFISNRVDKTLLFTVDNPDVAKTYVGRDGKAAGDGIREFYGDTDDFLVIDAMGSNWNDIPFIPDELSELLVEQKQLESELSQKTKEVKAYAKEHGIDFSEAEFKVKGYAELYDKVEEIYKRVDKAWGDSGLNGEISTNAIAEYAKRIGYKGVTIKNVVDIGANADNDDSVKANVSIFFNPQAQIKSADLVTYDDNGNVIPLSERFDSEKTDIRWALNNENAVFDESQQGKAVRSLKETAKDLGVARRDTADFISEVMDALGDTLQSGVVSDKTYEDVAKVVFKYAREETGESDYARTLIDIKKRAYEHGIAVPDSVKGDITDYGQFAKKHGNLFKRYTKGGENRLAPTVDEIYTDLAKIYPEIFPKDANLGDQIEKISEVIEKAREYEAKGVDKTLNEIYKDFDNAKGLAVDMASEIIDGIAESAGVELVEEQAVYEAIREADENIDASEYPEEFYITKGATDEEINEILTGIEETYSKSSDEYKFVKRLLKEEQNVKEAEKSVKDTKALIKAKSFEGDKKRINDFSVAIANEFGFGKDAHKTADVARSVKSLCDSVSAYLEDASDENLNSVVANVGNAVEVISGHTEGEVDIDKLGGYLLSNFTLLGKNSKGKIEAKSIEDIAKRRKGTMDVLEKLQKTAEISMEQLENDLEEAKDDLHKATVKLRGQQAQSFFERVIDEVGKVALADDMYYGRKFREQQLKDDMYYGRKLGEYKRRVADEVTKNKEASQRRKEDRSRRKKQEKLLKSVQRLSKLKTDKVTKELINEIVGNLDSVAISITDDNKLRLEALRKRYEYSKKNNEDFISDTNTEKLIERLDKTQISDLTVDELEHLLHLAMRLEQDIAYDKSIRVREKAINTHRAAKSGIRAIWETKGVNLDSGIKRLMNRYMTGLHGKKSFFKKIFNYEKNNAMYQVATALNDAERENMMVQQSLEKMFDNLIADDRIETFAGKKATEYSTGITDDRGREIKITPEMKVALYLASQNDDFLRHAKTGINFPNLKLLKNGKIADAYKHGSTVGLMPSEIKKIVSDLTEYEMEWANVAKEFFNERSKELINKASLELYGYEIANVENYFPIRTDPDTTGTEISSLVKNATIEGAGIFKDRTGAVNGIILENLTGVLQRHINQVSKFATLAVPIKNFNKAYKASVNFAGAKTTVAKEIGRKYGAVGQKFIENYISDLQAPRKAEKTFLDGLRNKRAASLMIANLPVTVGNLGNLFKAMPEVGAGAVVKNLVGKKVDVDLVSRFSPHLAARMEGYTNKELSDIARGNTFGRKKNIWSKMLNVMQFVDIYSTKVLWNASEYYVGKHFKNLEQGTDAYYKKVAEIFDNTVESSMVTDMVSQKADILMSSNPIINEITMFKSELFKNLDIMRDAVGEYKATEKKYGGRKELFKAAKRGDAEAKEVISHTYGVMASQVSTVMFVAVVNALMKGLWFEKWAYKDEEEDDVTAQSLLNGTIEDFAMGFISMFPGAEEAVTGLGYLLGKESNWYGNNITAFEMIDDVVEGVKDIINSIDKMQSGDVSWRTVAHESYDFLSKTVAPFFGIPAENLKNITYGTLLRAVEGANGKHYGKYLSLKISEDGYYKYTAEDMMDVAFKAYADGDNKTFDRIRSDMIDAEFVSAKKFDEKFNNFKSKTVPLEESKDYQRVTEEYEKADKKFNRNSSGVNGVTRAYWWQSQMFYEQAHGAIENDKRTDKSGYYKNLERIMSGYDGTLSRGRQLVAEAYDKTKDSSLIYNVKEEYIIVKQFEYKKYYLPLSYRDYVGMMDYMGKAEEYAALMAFGNSSDKASASKMKSGTMGTYITKGVGNAQRKSGEDDVQYYKRLKSEIKSAIKAKYKEDYFEKVKK